MTFGTCSQCSSKHSHNRTVFIFITIFVCMSRFSYLFISLSGHSLQSQQKGKPHFWGCCPVQASFALVYTQRTRQAVNCCQHTAAPDIGLVLVALAQSNQAPTLHPGPRSEILGYPGKESQRQPREAVLNCTRMAEGEDAFLTDRFLLCGKLPGRSSHWVPVCQQSTYLPRGLPAYVVPCCPGTEPICRAAQLASLGTAWHEPGAMTSSLSGAQPDFASIP